MKKIGIFAILAFFLLSTSSAEETEYTNQSFARISHIAGNTYIQRATDLAYEEGAVNMPVAEGDRLGTTDGRVEIYLGNGNYCRLDHDSKIDFLNLPQKNDDLIQIHVWKGNAYFSIKRLKKEKSFEVHTSDVSLYILDSGLYRVDVRENAETEIFVFEGMVEAAGESSSVLIKDQQRMESSQGRFLSHPTRFASVAEDSFDRWSQKRDSEIRQQLARRYLPEELEDFEYELASYGEWVYMPPYGYVWAPGGMDPVWRPYSYGRWVWLPLCGWTWHPFEPWGWVTFHYGRWHWSTGLGWYWIPTTLWGPAWVSWYWGYDYWGWAPLSWYGYPGVIINSVYYSQYSDRYYPPRSRALTVIHKNQLRAADVSKAALSHNATEDLNKIQFTSRKPSYIKPSQEIAVERLREDRFLLRKTESSRLDKKGGFPANTQGQIPETSFSETRKIRKDSSPSSPGFDERKILKKKIGYPSSPEIRLDESAKTYRSKKPSSFLGRIYDYISGGSKSLKSSSSRSRVSSGRISSGSKTGRSSSSSSSRSSGSSRSTSSTKKKKN